MAIQDRHDGGRSRGSDVGSERRVGCDRRGVARVTVGAVGFREQGDLCRSCQSLEATEERRAVASCGLRTAVTRAPPGRARSPSSQALSGSFSDAASILFSLPVGRVGPFLLLLRCRLDLLPREAGPGLALELVTHLLRLTCCFR